MIALILKTDGISVWFDEWEISAGDSIIQEINKGLHLCTHFFVLWSKNSSKSNWVRKELNSTLSRAIERKSLKVILICLDKTPRPPLLSDTRYIRYEEYDIEETRRNIIKAVLGIKPENSYHQAIEKAYREILQATKFATICPKCGGIHHEPFTAIDNAHDETYEFIRCLDCGYEWE
jgi:DNA-directed RNA polymerase subunit M/transcription elongation factor TFIIS